MQHEESMRIKCHGIPYRQGWLEVSSGIHRNFVNLETWTIAPDIKISDESSELSLLPDDAVSANTELELSLEQARALVLALQEAIRRTEHSVHDRS